MVGSAVATIVESSVETRMHNDKLENTITTFRKGRRFVWSVRDRRDFSDIVEIGRAGATEDVVPS